MNHSPHLILPTKELKESFQLATKERILLSTDAAWLHYQLDQFDEYLDYLAKLRVGQGAKGSVAQTVYWLVANKIYLGEIHIRHQASGKIPSHIYYDIAPNERKKGYGKLILQLGLAKAKELGLKEIIITCDQENIASRKIIVANGGKLVEDSSDKNLLAFRISLQQDIEQNRQLSNATIGT